MIVTSPAQDIAAWVEHRTNVRFRPPYRAVANVVNGKIEVAAIFQSQTECDVEISVVAERVTRPFLRYCYQYVFHQLKCQRATFRTRQDNFRAQVSLTTMGARHEGQLRRFYSDGTDALVYGLLKEDFRFEHS